MRIYTDGLFDSTWSQTDEELGTEVPLDDHYNIDQFVDPEKKTVGETNEITKPLTRNIGRQQK